MCPACLTTAVLIAGGIASAGGLAAAAVKRYREDVRSVDERRDGTDHESTTGRRHER
jgi:hypothetical protein